MQLDQFPRPRGDSGVGFHYCADLDHYDRQSLNYWLGELEELGASWLVLPSTLDRPVPDSFLRALIAARIEPVVKIDVTPIRPVDREDLLTVCRAYAECGVYYVQVYDEPNRATRWRIADWAAPSLVERFADMLFPALETVQRAGLVPLISPLAPGGHYWDLAFLTQLLDLLARDGRRQSLDRLGLCIHTHVGNRPISWGKGGPERWPYVRPYECPAGSQDQRGFCLHEWYDAIVREHLGESLPMISAETVLTPGAQDDPSFPVADEMTHSARSVDIARAVMDGEIPDYLFSVAFYTLTSGSSDSAEVDAWYKRDESTLPVVAEMKRLKKRARRFSWDDTASAGRQSTSARPIYHYLLIQTAERRTRSNGPSAPWILPAALDYVTHFCPTVGFSVEEALRAGRVTIVGTDSEYLTQAESALREAGCLVERVEATSEEMLRAALGGLVRRGRRFQRLPG